MNSMQRPGTSAVRSGGVSESGWRDEYVAKLQRKIQSQARELSEQAEELDAAHEYRCLCETRLRELSPSIELPLSEVADRTGGEDGGKGSADFSIRSSSSLSCVHDARGEPSHVLSTIAKFYNATSNTETKLKKALASKAAVDSKIAQQHESLKV